MQIYINSFVIKLPDKKGGNYVKHTRQCKVCPSFLLKQQFENAQQEYTGILSMMYAIET